MYRVFIKYCVIFLKCWNLSQLCQFCCSAGVLIPAWWCVYTHLHREKTESGKYIKIFSTPMRLSEILLWILLGFGNFTKFWPLRPVYLYIMYKYFVRIKMHWRRQTGFGAIMFPVDSPIFSMSSSVRWREYMPSFAIFIQSNYAIISTNKDDNTDLRITTHKLKTFNSNNSIWLQLTQTQRRAWVST